VSTQAIATAKEVFDLLRDDLSAIETELVRDAVSNVGAITDIADHLREGGGKRIRPSLLLLAAKSLGYQGHGMVRLGAVVEMVHTATLVHPPGQTFRQYHLGQLKMCAGRRLALYAGLSHRP
jgi:octaprenyl-diphosphate synthase